jgi:hypothetical protein
VDEPSWLRGAAVAANLAGVPLDEAVAGFAADDAAALASLLAGSAAAVPGSQDDHQPARDGRGAAGAVILASLLRALPAHERAATVRAFDPASLRRATAAATRAVECDGAALLLLVRRLANRIGSVPGTAELEALARVALGCGDASAPPAVHAVLRGARARAVPVRALFAPFAGVIAAAGGT